MEMNTEFITYPSANGQAIVSATLFAPADNNITAILQISHGMCEYIDRYRALALFLCSKGFLVCGNNHIGHRGSVKSDAELGYFAPQNGDRILVQDVHTLTGIVKERYPDLPFFLLGHSMGSFIARCCLAQFGTEYSGAILSGTGGPNPMAGAGIAMANAICKLQGEHKRSKLLETMAFGSYNKRFEKRTTKDWLTRDTAIVDAYLADPYCMFLFTASAFRDLFTLTKRANEAQCVAELPKDIPILLLSGEEDPVGNYGEGVRQVYQMIKTAQIFDVALRLYKGGRHELFNETNRDEVYADLYEWLKRKI